MRPQAAQPKMATARVETRTLPSVYRPRAAGATVQRQRSPMPVPPALAGRSATIHRTLLILETDSVIERERKILEERLNTRSATDAKEFRERNGSNETRIDILGHGNTD